MKRVLFFLMIIFFLISCSTTKTGMVYTEEEITFANGAIKEMAVLAARAAVTSLPAHIDSLQRKDLFEADFNSLLNRLSGTTGLNKRASELESSVRNSLKEFVHANYTEIDTLIVIDELENPHTIIQGNARAVTELTSSRFMELVSDSVGVALKEDPRVTGAETALLTLLNSASRIEAYRNGSEEEPPLRYISYDHAIASALNILTAVMGDEEEVIRSLAINYESPAIRLFAQ